MRIVSFQVSVLHASSLSQVIISEMLSQWGIEGLEKHIDEVEEFYRYASELLASLPLISAWAMVKQ